MGIEAVREHLKHYAKENDIIEFETSTANVALAADALNVEHGRIAKSMSFRDGESAVLVVAAGDVKIDNKKFKQEFGFKARMLKAEEVVEHTGHPVGGGKSLWAEGSASGVSGCFPQAVSFGVSCLWEYQLRDRTH